MKLLLDTNILIHLSKDPTLRLLEKVVGIDNQKVFISIVTIAELKSLSIQYDWGNRRQETLEYIFTKAIVIEATENEGVK